MKNVFLITLNLIMSFQAFSQSEIPEWFLKEMQNDIGVWSADNSKYQSEQEEFDYYVISWDWSINNQSLKGQLYGIHEGEKSPVFWEFRKFWDNEAHKPKVIQLGMNGGYGIGNIDTISDNETQLLQIFYAPNGTERKLGHKTLFADDSTRIDTSYSISQDGIWQKQRNYTWIKKPGEPNESNLDKIKIQQIHNQYVIGWLEMDEAKVLGLFEENARIQPNKLKPIEGKTEIRKFWFPQDSSITIINEYKTKIISLEVLDCLAVSTHTSELDWDYKKGAVEFGRIQNGINTTIYRKQKDGIWKIWRSMWTDISSKKKN